LKKSFSTFVRFKPFLRWLGLFALAWFALQIYFLSHIALMRYVNPSSTTFQRSQARQIFQIKKELSWRQDWVDSRDISSHLKRAVIASEDDIFATHDGVQWEAIERAWHSNIKSQQQTQTKNVKKVKIVGGSTITQQLAKNLFLSGERTFFRKSQEFILTIGLEMFLSKQRILEIYLNHVEWGQGVFGAQAAARHYFQKSASQLTPWEAARLAVILPRPKYFEKLPQSPYLSDRTEIILARMNGAVLP